MKTLNFVNLFVLLICSQCYSQKNFEQLTNRFNKLDLPIEAIDELDNSDTLNVDLVNEVFVANQTSPCYIKDGKKFEEDKYYGKIMRESASYTLPETNKEVSFSTKVYPIGQIILDKNYYSLIIKVEALETTFYDIYNFTKDGKLKSFVPLYLGYRDAPHKKEVSHIVINSEITKDGHINWSENMDGLETFRTYKLNSYGYFEIIKEEQKGEFEY